METSLGLLFCILGQVTGHNLQLDSTDMSYSGYFGPFQVIFPTVDVLSDLSLAGRLWRGQDEGIVRRSFGFELLFSFRARCIIQLFKVVQCCKFLAFLTAVERSLARRAFQQLVS